MTIPDEYYQATILFSGLQAPQGAAVVHGGVRNDELTAAEHATAIHDAFADAFCPRMTEFITVSGCLVKFGPDETGASGESTGIPRNGTVDAEGMQPGTAYLFVKQTALGGRRGKGRMFLPGVAEASVNSSGVIQPADVEDLSDSGAAYLAALELLGMGMVLLHSPSTEWVLVDGQPRRVPVAGAIPIPSPVTALSAQSTVATQRRRLR